VRRLAGVVQGGTLNKEEVAAWTEAYQFILLLRMRTHRQQREEGQELDNYLNPDELNDLDRRILKEAFRQARKLQSRLALDYRV
jgi:CBS domain-containing protein